MILVTAKEKQILFPLALIILAIPCVTFLYISGQKKAGVCTFEVVNNDVITIQDDAAPARSNLIIAKRSIDVSDLKNALLNVSIRTKKEVSPNVAMGLNLTLANREARCPTPKGRRILINYAANCCRRSQPKNCDTGLTVGGFDVCISFTDTSLDDEFKRKNDRVLKIPTGGGLWLWKPYIILKTLTAMNEDDVLFYVDAGSYFIDNMDAAHICLQEQLGLDIVLFTGGQREKWRSKSDAFVLMNVDLKDPKFTETDQLLGGFVLLRKTFRSIQFISQWLSYAQDYRILGNEKSQFSENSKDFRGHRNDQSVLSLLSKKWGIEAWPDPSQWGDLNPNAARRQQPRYQLINHTFIALTRDKS